MIQFQNLLCPEVLAALVVKTGHWSFFQHISQQMCFAKNTFDLLPVIFLNTHIFSPNVFYQNTFAFFHVIFRHTFCYHKFFTRYNFFAWYDFCSFWLVATSKKMKIYIGLFLPMSEQMVFLPILAESPFQWPFPQGARANFSHNKFPKFSFSFHLSKIHICITDIPTKFVFACMCWVTYQITFCTRGRTTSIHNIKIFLLLLFVWHCKIPSS